MGILSLLNDVSIAHYGRTYDISLNFIGEIIKWLINGIGVVGIGIIVFSIILKLIVMPFDVFQRISMRKQNIKMKANQEKLKKLQQQYANDKQKYNEKMMEFYKANGISMMSSCLPMILSMVIFFVAIGAFTSYSQYANINNYNTMVTAYNQTIESYTADINVDNMTYSYEEEIPGQESGEVEYVWRDDCTFDVAEYLTFKDIQGEKYIYVRVPFNREDPALAETEKEAQVKYAKKALAGKVLKDGSTVKYYYMVDTATMLADAELIDGDEFKALKEKNPSKDDDFICAEYIRIQAREAVENKYHGKVKDDMGFLWIKNIWQTDAAYKHPVLSFTDFKGGMGNEEFDVDLIDDTADLVEINKYSQAYSSSAYNEITKNLSEEKDEPNGFFILIVLSIGTILLQQFITMKSQKAQSQFSTVDGQGKSQQKIMLVVMTGMFAIFSFMYSSAFSIYMITSNIFSLGSMLLINKIVDVVLEKKEAKKLQEKYSMPSYRREKTEKNKKK
ncbi:MAG: YidC/Oxa1 family membrane protein insertase [Clostridia bacterium]|nr:YidC/Oxa1 family membrane protein insertase [Clostridia bacterium]